MSNRLILRRRPVRRPRQGAQLQTTLFRALAVVRAVVLCYAVALTVTRRDEFAHPSLAWLVLGGMVLWSGLVTWAYDSPRRRQLPWLAVDLAMAVAALASTPYVESAAMLHGSAATVPSYWVIAAVLAWSLRYGWVPGVAAAVLVCLVDLSVRVVRDATTWGNIFLILLAASVVGYAAEMVRTASEERARAERSAAALAERVRLARAVHDGVLQVLALVQRRGAELGGEAAELGRLAGEQEVALRALVQSSADQLRGPAASTGGHGIRSQGARTTDDDQGAGVTADLAAGLAALATATVTVSTPGSPVLLDRHTAGELVAAVRACLSNVARHAGPDARAWVLLERNGDEVTVTVRDDGPGIPDGRLAEALVEGRMGVGASIRGRMSDLGGTATLATGPGQGVEWELQVPTSRTRGVRS